MRLTSVSRQIWFCVTIKEILCVCASYKSCDILLYRLNEVCVCVRACVRVCVCVRTCLSRGDNPVSRLHSPSETSLSHFIHFDPVLGNSLISHNAVDQ